MKFKPVVGILLLFVLALALTACGGGGGGGGGGGTTGSPEDGAKAFFEAVFAGTGDVAATLCTTNQAMTDAIKQGMETLKTTLTAAGGEIDVSGLTYAKTSESGDTAVVTVAGKMKVSVSGVSQEVDFPESPVQMKNENGWKVCG